MSYSGKEIKYEIDKNGCFNCTSHKISNSGYPMIRRIEAGSNNMAVSRYIYIKNNSFLTKDIVVRHKCDNRRCINIEHLEIGTRADNVKDRVERNRNAIQLGEINANSSLTNKNVVEILLNKENRNNE
jgi:hypothetical protein